MLQDLAPLYSAGTRLLVLGSFPGVASLEKQQYYYGHAQNHFWKITATLLSPVAPAVLAMDYAQRCHWLLESGVGLWDVYAACEREGSLDSNIRHARPNDLSLVQAACPQLHVIAHNSGESFKHAGLTRALGVPVMCLPSSSPANAGWSFDRKLQAWREVFKQAGLPVIGSQ
ncbi:MAG: DNA-deoxyinosine glycosylase [Limnohabitans sp.]|nr:DNA-deoxyinosine glycosylase [Limnohabitans sp.]